MARNRKRRPSANFTRMPLTSLHPPNIAAAVGWYLDWCIRWQRFGIAVVYWICKSPGKCTSDLKTLDRVKYAAVPVNLDFETSRRCQCRIIPECWFGGSSVRRSDGDSVTDYAALPTVYLVANLTRFLKNAPLVRGDNVSPRCWTELWVTYRFPIDFVERLGFSQQNVVCIAHLSYKLVKLTGLQRFVANVKITV